MSDIESSTEVPRRGLSNALVALGAVLLVVVAVLVAIASNSLEARLLQASFPAVLAVGLIAYGRRHHRTFAATSDRPLFEWILATLLYFVFVGVWFFVLSESYETSIPLAIVTSMAAGVALGAVIGVYALRLHASNDELAETNEQVAETNAELERANAELNAFASIVSHDLRNPVQVASGSLDILAESVDDDDPNVERIGYSLDRIDEIIENVLVLTRSAERVDGGDPVDVGDVATRAWRTADTDDATLVVEDPPVVFANEGLLATLLENLFRNSAQHGSASNRTRPGDSAEPRTASTRATAGDGGCGDGTVTVTVGALPDDDGFYVDDDGPGVPAAVRENAFELGESGSGGTGLGLYVVGRVADVHGWTYRLTDGDDGGARFEFRT